MTSEHDAFIATRVPERFRPAAAAFVALVARVAPELQAGMRGGTDKYIPVPVWRLGRDLVVLSPSQKGVTVSFAQGARFADPAGLLGGAGKVSRTLVLKTVADVERPEVVGFLRQAVEMGA
jgi:hypothetical protein